MLGARGIEFNRERSGQRHRLRLSGRAKPGALRLEFDGERLFSCASALGSDDTSARPPGNGPVPLEIDCDMAGGSSGGGWVNGRGALIGLTSYGYQGDFHHLYGPYHGSIAEELYTSSSGPPLRLRGHAGDQPRRLRRSQDFAGGAGADVFKLVGGDDRVAARRRQRRACGGGGNDRLAGEAGGDHLRGGGGRDLIFGGPGPRRLRRRRRPRPSPRVREEGADSLIGGARRRPSECEVTPSQA